MLWLRIAEVETKLGDLAANPEMVDGLRKIAGRCERWSSDRAIPAPCSGKTTPSSLPRARMAKRTQLLRC